VDNQLEKFETWISKMFANRLKKEVCYHNLNHTKQVVKKVKEIAEYYKLGEVEQEELFYSGWLHDVGYWDGEADGHEARGAQLTQEWLTEYGLSQERIDVIKSAILATKVPQNPQNLLESIICDADLYHLSSGKFYEQTILLKQERENIINEDLDMADWLKGSQTFMLSHHYHTDYAKEYLQPGKEKNLELLKDKIKVAEAQSGKKPKG